MAALEDLVAALAAAESDIKGGNPYSTFADTGNSIGQVILGMAAKPDLVKDMGAGELIAGALASGLTGGLFNQLGANYESGQRSDYTKALVGALRGQDVAQGDMDDSLFSRARDTADLMKLSKKMDLEDQETMLDYEVDKAGRMETAKEKGKLKAYEDDTEVAGAKGAVGSLLNPKIEKEVGYTDTLRKEFQGQPAYQNFAKAQTGFNTLIQAKDDPSKVSDLDFVYGAIQMIEPGMAVKEGEQAAVQNTQALPEKIKAQMMGALEGSATLTPETRDAILRLGARRYDQYYNQYNSALEGYKNRASKYAGSGDDISFLPPSGTSKDLLGTLLNAKSATGAPTQINATHQLQVIADRLKGGGVSAVEKAQLLKSARELAAMIKSGGAEASKPSVDPREAAKKFGG